MWKASLLAAGISFPIVDAAAADPLGPARHPIASEASHGVQLTRYRAHRRSVARRHAAIVRRAGYPGGYVVAPVPYAAPAYLAAPGLVVPRGAPGGYVAAPVPYTAPTYLAAPGLVVPRSVPGDRGDPLHRYYTPGVAPNVGNPSVSPSYQNPAVDSGLLFPGTGRN